MEEFELARLKSAREQVAAARRRLENAQRHLLQVPSASWIALKAENAIAQTMNIESNIRDRVADDLKGRRGNG